MDIHAQQRAVGRRQALRQSSGRGGRPARIDASRVQIFLYLISKYDQYAANGKGVASEGLWGAGAVVKSARGLQLRLQRSRIEG
eukprot:5553225-Prymnesium_polylepis.1